MITTELFKEAMSTLKDICPEEDCIFYKAFEACDKELTAAALTTILQTVGTGTGPTMLIALGVHLGYRVRQLELEADTAPNETVN
jgi:hypothetical protein